MAEKYICQTADSLQTVLGEFFPDSSMRTRKSWITHGRITVDDRVVKKPHHLVEKGSSIHFHDKKPQISEGIIVLYQDADIVVIDKPSGLLSVATPYEENKSAHDILKEYFPKTRVYPVHRLDRETSGVLLFALSERARDVLKDAFASRKIEREYIAIVEGQLDDKKGTWRQYLTEDKSYTMRKASPQIGKLTITHFETISSTPAFSALKIRLETGKKNQIRVCSSIAGHPIVGDVKYGSEQNPIGRVGLHARSLGFVHPIAKKTLHFTSPIPGSFTQFMRKK